MRHLHDPVHFPAMPAFWMIVSSLLFACMGVCVKLAATDFSTGEIVFYRGLVSALMMLALALMRGTPLRTPHWRMHLSRSGAGTIALVSYFFALGVLPLATAVTLNYTAPIFVAVLLVLAFRERLHWLAVIAVMIGFVGVAVLLRPSLQPGQWLGALIGLGAGLFSSIAYLSVRKLGSLGEPEVRIVFWFSLTATLVGLPWMLAGDTHSPSPVQLATLLGAGLFGGAAQLAMTRSYSQGRTVVSANLSYATVIFASLFGMLIWDEAMPWTSWLGISLIIAGAVMVSLSPRREAAATRPD